MALVNANYLKLKGSYLFSEIGRRVRAYQEANPEAHVIRLGIGDVTRPLPPAVIEAMHRAVDEMGAAESFRGYGPERGYAFLAEAIAAHDFAPRGINLTADEIFVSDGAKSDTANIQELFAAESVVALTDPVYPVYVDSNVMAGRAGTLGEDGRYDRLVYLPSTAENNFRPPLPESHVDLIYLCYPNNPTGAVATRAMLEEWVGYAQREKAVILYDAAYEAYIRDDGIPHSIYEIPGAREVAIEFRSFSKTAGFTGTRCAFTVVPKRCMAYTAAGEPQPLHSRWNRRHTTKFNGVAYPIQRAAAAIYTLEGQAQIKAINDGYLANAALIRKTMQGMGFAVTGGINSPYIWVEVGQDSWEFFDKLLHQAQVVTTPGAGFGRCGEGFIRISAFNGRAQVEEAMERIAAL